MTQNGILYDIVQIDGNQVVLQMNAGHPVYAGHFPGTPITPGVLTMQMIRECTSLKTGRNLRFTSIKNCRLAAMVRPGDILRLKMETSDENGTVKLKATLTDANNDEDLRLQLDAELQ
jgi:3-hydroxyacyl-[acyl-carrier-protein] dehydratase